MSRLALFGLLALACGNPPGPAAPHTILFTNQTAVSYYVTVVDSARSTLYVAGWIPGQVRRCVALTVDNQSNPLTDATVLNLTSAYEESNTVYVASAHVAPDINWIWSGTSLGTASACHP